MRIWSTVALSLLTTAAPRLAAQQTLSLTLAEAEKLAAQNNPQIAGARFNAAALHQARTEIRAGLAPYVTGSLTGVGA